jgi:hypothetical protein
MNLMWAIVAQTAGIVGGCLVVILYNNGRFNAIDHRFEDLLRYFGQRFKNIEEHLGRLEERVAKIEDRLEHPVYPGR